MIRILVVGMTETIGGLENFIMNYYRQFDKNQLQIDFLCRFPHCAYQEEIEKRGSRVFNIMRRSKNPIQYYQEIHAFFRKNGESYDVLWDNECMFNDITPLQLAARYNIPMRIAHSHNAGNMDTSVIGRLQELLHHLQKHRMTLYATNLWACSNAAGSWAFSERAGALANFRIIPNAIDSERFAFDFDARTAIRKRLALDNRFTIGCVGRLQYQKNQALLLQAFALFTKHPLGEDARLLLLGSGPDAEALQAQTVSLGIESSVVFLGYHADTETYLQAMDVFALPSRFEGLGIAAIEAQCSGLPCLLSRAIPTESAVTDLVRFLPNDNPASWFDAFLNLAETRPTRYSRSSEIEAAGYGINDAARRLAELFKQQIGVIMHA